MASFHDDMAAGYGFTGSTVRLGRPWVVADEPDTAVEIAIPLRFLNRHGLIAGATGTGKTRTLQLIAEQISAAGCPVFAADMKGDLAGIGAPGTAGVSGDGAAGGCFFPHPTATRRTSNNVVDRRGSGGRNLAMGGGIGGIIMALIAIFVAIFSLAFTLCHRLLTLS